jgi:glutamyl-tRNA reductase
MIKNSATNRELFVIGVGVPRTTGLEINELISANLVRLDRL